MNLKDEVKNLKKIVIFDKLSDNDIEEMLSYAKIEIYESGSVIFKEKDKGSSLYIVLSGVVKVYRDLADGSSHDIANFKQYEFFGEMSFMDNQNRSASATALESTVLISFDSQGFENFSEKYPSSAFKFHKNIITEIQARLRKTNDRYSYHFIWGKMMKDALNKNYEELVQSNIELASNKNFLYNVINNSTEIIIVLDKNTNVMIFNSGAENNLGIKSNEIMGKNMSSFFCDNNYNVFLEKINSFKIIQNYECEMKNFAGNKLCVSISAFVLNGDPFNNYGDGIVIMAHNITARRILEKQILQNEKMIFLGKVISEIIHDIRNPLTIIQLSSEYIAYRLNTYFDEKLNQNMTQIEESVTRIQKIMSNTLEFARAIPNSKKESINLIDIIEKSINISKIGKRLEKYEIILKNDFNNVVVIGNASQLEQVFINLISNAIQSFNDDISGVVTIKISDDKDNFIVSVKDNGLGITADIMPHIFEPFFTTKTSGDGIGLGLSICKAIINQHDGSIICKSSPGDGSEFVITLPKTHHIRNVKSEKLSEVNNFKVTYEKNAIDSRDL